MKTMKLIYAIALATTLAAATGCKHAPGYLTKLPGQNPSMIPDPTGGKTLQGEAMNPPEPRPITTGNIEAADTSRWPDMNEDRSALANYTVHFAYDSAAVKSSEQSNLRAVAGALGTDTSAKLLIEGHCDERGTEEYNRSLGERRALALREALAKLGVDPMRVRTVSYGKDKPADPGHDESAWSKNRRGEFILLHPKTGA